MQDGKCTIRTTKLEDLKAPSVQMTLQVLSHWSMHAGQDYRAALECLAESTGYGLHSLAWYLRWMMYNYATEKEAVLFRINRLRSVYALNDFKKATKTNVIDSYEAQMRRPGGPSALDSYPLLLYDYLLRADRANEAQYLLSKCSTRVLGEFLGLPFVRCILTQKTEATLWTLAACPHSPCLQPSNGRTE